MALPGPGLCNRWYDAFMLMKAQDAMNTSNASAPQDEGVPVSVKIRERIQAARKRFHANDNIAEFIEPGELDKLLDEVTVKMEGVLDSLVIDTVNDHNTGDTARRVAKMYLKEVFMASWAFLNMKASYQRLHSPGPGRAMRTFSVPVACHKQAQAHQAEGDAFAQPLMPGAPHVHLH